MLQELDALIEAVTNMDESAKFKFDEFRTLMTYPKCGIAKTFLKGHHVSDDPSVVNSFQ